MRLAPDWLRGVVTGCRLVRSLGELPAMVVSLATGVGLSVAAYSLIHAVLIRPLPYADPGRLVQVWEMDSERMNVRVLRDRDIGVLATEPSPFQHIAGHAVLQRDLVPGPGMVPVQLVGAHVSVDLFTVLGRQAARGRTFRPEDSQLTDISPIMVSERLVRSGLVSGRLGDTVEFEGGTYRLVGTMPETFWFPDRETSFWAPVLVVPRERVAPPGLSATGTYSTSSRAIARLRPGVSAAAAQAQANVRLGLPSDGPGRVRYRVEPHAALLTAPVRPALRVLQAGSGLVLLLVGLNVGWLFAARGRRLRQTFATLRALREAQPGVGVAGSGNRHSDGAGRERSAHRVGVGSSGRHRVCRGGMSGDGLAIDRPVGDSRSGRPAPRGGVSPVVGGCGGLCRSAARGVRGGVLRPHPPGDPRRSSRLAAGRVTLLGPHRRAGRLRAEERWGGEPYPVGRARYGGSGGKRGRQACVAADRLS